MNNNKNNYLNIKGAVLDKVQLQNFMEKTAINYEITNKSNKSTYPIIRLNENYLFIEKTFELLNNHIKKQIDIHPAGEWLLDNFYIIEETVKKINKELTLKKYKDFPGISNGIYEGYARIYLLASEIVAYTDNKIDDEILKLSLISYQKQKNLSMEEIWNLWLFLEIAIIENIRAVCEKIYLSQMQKYKVEGIIERLVEKKPVDNQIFKQKINSKLEISYKDIKYSFIEYMSYKLKKYGKQGVSYMNILEEQVNKMGINVSEAIKKEHFDIAMQKVLIGNSITSIREINRINFAMLFGTINGVEEILKQDPAKVYEKMDYKTKGYYRAKIKEIAKKTKTSENYIAKKAIEEAKDYTEHNNDQYNKQAHVGYYLIDRGVNKLYKNLNIGKKKVLQTRPETYIASVYIVTAILCIFWGIHVYKKINDIVCTLIISMFAVIPISEIYIQSLNYILVKFKKPKLIPKLDLSNGIPEEYATMVAIPTIISSKEKVKEIVEKLETYYLANKSDNLYFTLLRRLQSISKEN